MQTASLTRELSPISSELSRHLLERRAATLRKGRLSVEYPDGRRKAFGDPGAQPVAELRVLDNSLFRRLLFEGEVGLGEAYMDGLWRSESIPALLELCALNRAQLDFLHSPLAVPARLNLRRMHRRNRNTRGQANANIHSHFGVGTEFFRLVLDETITYSCGVFPSPDASLAEAQRNKYRMIAEKANLRASDRVLDIGSGWGQFATQAAQTYGCRVTGLTLLDYQLTAARQRVEAGGVSDLVDLQRCDYRDVQGRYDKIVAIEMLEHVGSAYFESFFRVCDSVLRPGGRLVVQVISVPERLFAARYAGLSFVTKYIFPGGELPSISALERALAPTSLRLTQLEDIGEHYVRTLHQWRENLLSNLPEVRLLGYDDRFIRMWDYYLASCEGGFRAKTVSDVQLVFEKAA